VTPRSTHHRDLVALDADVGPPEVAQSGDGGDAGRVHQVPVVVQQVNVHSDLPHLHTHTHTHTHHTLLLLFSLYMCVCVCVCVSPFPQTPHTGTRCRCTWSSSSISPAAGLTSPTARIVWRENEEEEKHPSHVQVEERVTNVNLVLSFSPALFKRRRGHRRQLDVEEHDALVWATFFRGHQLARHLGHDPERSTATLHYHSNMIFFSY